MFFTTPSFQFFFASLVLKALWPSFGRGGGEKGDREGGGREGGRDLLAIVHSLTAAGWLQIREDFLMSKSIQNIQTVI